MIRDMREFTADMRRHIEQWKAELAEIGKPENAIQHQVVESLRSWINAGEVLIASLGY